LAQSFCGLLSFWPVCWRYIGTIDMQKLRKSDTRNWYRQLARAMP